MTHSQKIKRGLARSRKKSGRPRKHLPIDEIRLLRRIGKSHKYIAERYEVSAGTVCNKLNRRKG